MSLGIYAVKTYHTNFNIPHLYSLHSWAGVAFLAIFGSNYVLGFLSYGPLNLVPDDVRRNLLPLHAALGLASYLIGGAVMILGFAEKVSFNKSCNVTGLLQDGTPVTHAIMSDCIFGNVLGLCVLLSMLLTVLALVLPKSTSPSDLFRDDGSERQALLS